MIRVVLSLCGLLTAGHMARAQDVRFEAAVTCIKKYEGLHDKPHGPYIGYGHRLLPGEKFQQITLAEADSLLRVDLRQKCAVFRRFGADSLLLGVLAYNVGEYALLGTADRPKSRLIRKIESGGRDFYAEYISFCRYKGKTVPSIERRRKEEYELLFK